MQYPGAMSQMKSWKLKPLMQEQWTKCNVGVVFVWFPGHGLLSIHFWTVMKFLEIPYWALWKDFLQINLYFITQWWTCLIPTVLQIFKVLHKSQVLLNILLEGQVIIPLQLMMPHSILPAPITVTEILLSGKIFSHHKKELNTFNAGSSLCLTNYQIWRSIN